MNNHIPKSIWGGRPHYSQMPNRRIVANRPDLNLQDNQIKTSKYTWLTFLPLNLKKQFLKLANLYFLIIGILQMVPQITNSNGLPVIYIPLIFVVSVSVIKDAFQDYKRYLSDKQENNLPARVVGNPNALRKDLRVGDVVVVRREQAIPADMLILCSSDPKNQCYIQTKNLDGQTNLKSKFAKFELARHCGRLPANQIAVEVSYQRPNPHIYQFTGSAELEGRTVIFDNSNIVLRGCNLKITEQVRGLVLYNGYDSKMMLNSNKSRTKKSRLEFRMGRIVVLVFLLQIALTFSAGLIRALKIQFYAYPYHEPHKETPFWLLVFQIFGAWSLLFSNFVPISLIVSLEMVKFVQGLLMSRKEEELQINVQNSSLNEELGQIEHIFSDKTGTLTCNYMSFKAISLNKSSYGEETLSKRSIDSLPKVTNVNFRDQKFIKLARQRSPEVLDVLRLLALCHSIIVQDCGGTIQYNASSPDELAMINFSKFCGVEYKGLDENDFIQLRVHGVRQLYKLHHTFQFDSDRKRMTVVVTDERGQHWVLTKGADNMMLRICSQDTNKTYYGKELSRYSNQGLRTLVLGRRRLTEIQFNQFNKAYTAALQAQQLVYRIFQLPQKKHRPPPRLKLDLHEGLNLLTNQLLEVHQEQESELHEVVLQEPQPKKKIIVDIQNSIESDLELIGITAVQDRLQTNVKQTIQSLRAAGIKFWMLTGDKEQTAISIGYSCGAISNSMELVILKEHSIDQIRIGQSDKQYCLVVDGDALIPILNNFKQTFFRLCAKCNSVICCRVSPKQKQEVVLSVRKYGNTVLSIGDGANDVNMINAAHVGVGIKGVEGTQAARSADYTISQFQLLSELVLNHGRECYRRNCCLIAYTFYKNLLLVLPQLWLGLASGLSALSFYDPVVYQLFNVFFTGLPIIVYAVYDREFSGATLRREVSLYKLGLEWQMSDSKYFSRWIGDAVAQSFVIFHIGMRLFSQSRNGLITFMNQQGMAIMGIVVIICNVKILLISYQYSAGQIIIVFGSTALFFIGVLLLNSVEGSFTQNSQSLQFKDQQFYWMTATCVSLSVSLWGVHRILGRMRNDIVQVSKQRSKVQKQIELPLVGNQYA